MDYITVRQAAGKWGVSMRWIQILLKDGRIDGAIQPARDWLIPASATKPEDKRKFNKRRPPKDKPEVTS